MKKNKRVDLSLLPSVHQVLERISASHISHEILVRVIRLHIHAAKRELGKKEYSKEALLNESVHHIERHVKNLLQPHLRRVINGTGVILNTMLGRAPLAAQDRKSVV